MRPIGFSTGAISKGDAPLAVNYLRAANVRAVELSALRIVELTPLLHYSQSHSLEFFSFVSVHAPSAFAASDEQNVVRILASFTNRGWPVVVHPDAIYQPRYWAALGSMLLIENMDKRKPIGRTAGELRHIFTHLPQAQLCLDLAHARQVDSSMTEAYLIVREFAGRIRQLHVSEVATSSRHARLSPVSIGSYAALEPSLPRDVPVILESPVERFEILNEVARARLAFNEATPVSA